MLFCIYRYMGTNKINSDSLKELTLTITLTLIPQTFYFTEIQLLYDRSAQ